MNLVDRAALSGRFRAHLVASAALWCWVLAVSVIGLSRPTDLFLGVAIDACAWAWLLACSATLSRARGAGWRVAGALLFYPLFYVSLLCTFLHTYFFDSATERRVSLLDLDLGTVASFLTRVLPGRAWILLGGLLAVVHVTAWLGSRRSPVVHAAGALVALSGITGVTAFVAYRAQRVPSALVDLVSDVRELVVTPRLHPDPGARSPYPETSLDRRSRSVAGVPPRFKKVLVFVMETMTERQFAIERASLPPEAFVNGAMDHVHRYSRYFTNNQDSRTGMLDMLDSRVIPYEAYTEYGRDHYTFLARKPSLVDRFNALGYETAYAVSQTDPELVVGDLAWKRTIHVTEAQIRSHEKDALCFVPYEFEHGCEDRVILPDVLDFLDRSERAFLYQEFIWGHDIEYNQASGKTNTQYYSAYIGDVIAHLRERGTLDDTLVVVTSDHGYRGREAQTEPYVYRIPLWFYSPGFQHVEDDRLFSHVDLDELLFHESAGSPKSVPSDPFVLIVGPTSSGLMTVMTPEEDFLLFKMRGDRRYLLRSVNLRGGPARVDPVPFVQLFDQYRQSFDAFGRQ